MALCSGPRYPPEWFYRFTSQDGDENYYLLRDKEAAKQYLEQRIALWKNGRENVLKKGFRKLTEGEAEELRKFFEETWEHYKELSPVIIKVLHPLTQETSEELLSYYLKIADCLKPEDANDRIRKALSSFLIYQKGAGEILVEADIASAKLTPFILP